MIRFSDNLQVLHWSCRWTLINNDPSSSLIPVVNHSSSFISSVDYIFIFFFLHTNPWSIDFSSQYIHIFHFIFNYIPSFSDNFTWTRQQGSQKYHRKSPSRKKITTGSTITCNLIVTLTTTVFVWNLSME